MSADSVEQHLPLVLRRAASKARHLARTMRLASDHADDLAQELALDAWRRLPSFNPQRSGIEPFLALLLRHRGEDLRSRAGHRHSPLEDAYDGDTAYQALAWRGASDVEALEQAIDISKALRRLPPELRAVALGLEDGPQQLARRMGVGRSTIHRRTKQLRAALRELGIGPAETGRHRPRRGR